MMGWDEQAHMLKGTCPGLSYLHAFIIAHQDIKAYAKLSCMYTPRQNILLTIEFRAKIADFGFAIQLKKKSAAGQTRTVCTAIRSIGG